MRDPFIQVIWFQNSYDVQRYRDGRKGYGRPNRNKRSTKDDHQQQNQRARRALKRSLYRQLRDPE